MLSAVRLRATVLIPLVALLWSNPAHEAACAGADYLAVVTIYNRSNVQLHYQLRCYRNGQWTEWKNHTHRYPRNGWHWHTYRNAEKIQIRFDRIGGDNEYTEKRYDLEFNRVGPNRQIGRHHGRPYYFQFDAGGRLLDLYRYNW